MKALITSLAIAVGFAVASRAQESSLTPTASEATAAGTEIPSGYQICENEPSHRPVAGLEKTEEHEKTISPDCRFAVLCPVRDEKSERYPPNLLVRLKPYAVLAKLNKDGVPSYASLEINATWQGNSTVAIWEYHRWGLVSNISFSRARSLQRLRKVRSEN